MRLLPLRSIVCSASSPIRVCSFPSLPTCCLGRCKMTSFVPRRSNQEFRRALLVGTALGLITIFSAPRQAAAQFQADHSVGGGSVSFPDSTHITVDTPSAIINWVPTDSGAPTDVNGNWAFMPSGNTMDFSSTGNFAVLNRILPGTDSSLKVAIDGAITSHVGAETGGFFAFYTPNGLIIGPTAQFDVGSLMLTTLDPTNFMTAATADGYDFQFAPA